ncbi:MAG: hypothetical protein JO332_08500 [Planctomycetaceae bacterium]|nr:hypothetical protein [Planctomycetaceae bacterium]
MYNFRYPMIPSRAVPWVLPIVFWAAGLLMGHGSMLVSGLSRVQGDQIDSGLLQYVLEHEVRWATGDPAHARLWDPPTFYPAPNVAAYSESLLGVAPLYGFWRLLGVPWDAAYGLWLMTITTLNFVAVYLLLFRTLRFGAAASSFGAFLFAFASSRFAHIGQSQLLAGFYLAPALHALVRIFSAEGRHTPGVLLFFAACVAQIYACFYIGWFLGLALAVALFAALLRPDLRTPLISTLRRNAVGIGVGVAGSVLLLLPFLMHSLRAAADLGPRPFDEVEMFLPRPAAWIYMGAGSWIYGWQQGCWPFDRLPAGPTELAIGIGVVAPVIALLGLFDRRTTPLGKLLLVLCIALPALTTILPGGFGLWGAAYLTVPGASAIRAVGRVSFVLLLPMAVGAAAFLDARCRRRPLLLALAALALLEQGRRSADYDRREARERRIAIARRVRPESAAFFYSARESDAGGDFAASLSWRHHVDAMLASLECGIPTLNGYSGGVPAGWPFLYDAVLQGPAHEERVRQGLKAWCARHAIDEARVQWIRGR